MTTPRDEWIEGLTGAALTLRTHYPQLAYWVALARDEIARRPPAAPTKPERTTLAEWLAGMHDYARPEDQPNLMRAAELLRGAASVCTCDGKRCDGWCEIYPSSPDETSCDHPASTGVRAWKCDFCGKLHERDAVSAPPKTAVIHCEHCHNPMSVDLGALNGSRPRYKPGDPVDCIYCGNLRGNAHADDCPRRADTRP